ncbi:MAG: translocation/assembly module TamB domain-containing protein [Halanaerobiaceae bacterium]
MKYKFVLYTALLMLVVLIGLFIFKSSNLLLGIEDELISYIENNYQIEINVAETSFWPINQIVLKDVEFSSDIKGFSFSVPQVSIYYNLFAVFSGEESFQTAVEYIDLKKPEVRITDIGNFSFVSENNDSDIQTYEDRFNSILNQIYSTSPFDIQISEGHIIYDYESNNVEITNLNFLLKIINDQEMRLEIESDLMAEKLDIQGDIFNNLDINNLALTMTFNEYNWQGFINTDFVNIAHVNPYLQRLLNDNEYIINLAETGGRFKPELFISGNYLSINSYNGNIFFEDINSVLDIDDNIANNLNIPIDDISDNNYLLNNLGGNININSSQELLNITELKFNLNDVPFLFSGLIGNLYSQDRDIYGHLQTNRLTFMNLGILPEDINVSGSTVMDLIIEGSASDISLNLDMSLEEGSFNDVEINNFLARVRYYEDSIYLDQMDLIFNEDNQFSLEGLYKLTEEKYSMNLLTRNFDIGVLQDLGIKKELFAELSNFEGNLNISTNINGNSLSFNKVNASGKIDILDPAFDGMLSRLDSGIQVSQLNKLSSEFYLASGKVMLEDGGFSTAWDEVAFSGEINLNNALMDIDIHESSLKLENISNDLSDFAQISPVDIDGTFILYGNITGEFTSPVVDIGVRSYQGTVEGIAYDDLRFAANYQDDNIIIKDIVVQYKDLYIRGGVEVGDLQDKQVIEADLYTDDTEYQILDSILSQADLWSGNLPIEGEVGLKLSINGMLANPEILLQASSTNTDLLVDNIQVPIDSIDIDVQKTDRGFFLSQMVAKKDEAALNVNGDISTENLNLLYDLQNFNLNNLPDELIKEKINGQINLSGKVEGNTNSPEISGELKLNNIIYQNKKLGNINGDIVFKEKNIDITRLIWQSGQQNYTIDGKILNIYNNLSLDLVLSIEEGKVDDFMLPDFDAWVKELPLNDYYVEGLINMKGNINNPVIVPELRLINKADNSDYISVEGIISNEMNLAIQGNNIMFSRFAELYTQSDITGNIDFIGKISGDFNSINANIDTSIRNVVFEDIKIDVVTGDIVLSNSQKIEFYQEFLFSNEGQRLSLNGSLPFESGLDSLELSFSLDEFPLGLVPVYNPEWSGINGNITGDLFIKGSYNDPLMSGRLKLNQGSVEPGLPAQFSDLVGDIVFEGKKVEIPGMIGKYGSGDILIQGSIKPFNNQQNYDLFLKGEDLPFDYGSFNGKFDPELTITGPFSSPLFVADIVTHDLNIGIPIEWPTTRGESDINLKYNLTLYPDDNVTLSNNNINIPVQEGSLNINNTDSDGEIIFDGRLSSEQGTFDFYNNMFIIETASAIFERSFVDNDSFIPEVDVRARTNVRGTRIQLRLNGEVNNMVTTFTSLPPLERDEILNLLTSRGGIGEFASGDFGQIFQSELYRVLHSQLQLDFIGDIQERFRSIFELDRFEVDTYNLGWNNEVSIYLGKYINDSLYLEYTDTITPELDNFLSDSAGELSLLYYINDNVMFETSWQGNDDYSLSIESNFEF